MSKSLVEETLGLVHSGTVGALLLLAAPHGLAQSASCDSDHACAEEVRSDGMFNRGEPWRCPRSPVDVVGASQVEWRYVCEAAFDALRLLVRCGIPVHRPLGVKVLREIRHPAHGGLLLGLFDTTQEKVLVAALAEVPTLVRGSAYARLPEPEFYRSLIVHELVHAVMHQNLKRPASSHAAYEYPAYALQIESLPPHTREKFLQAFDRSALAADGPFSDPLLLFDPHFFAARAYTHFKNAANGCERIQAVLQGESSFILALPNL